MWFENWASNFTTAVSRSAGNIATDAGEFLPNLAAALVIFLAGYLVSVIASWILNQIFKLVHLEEFLKNHKLDKAMGNVPVSRTLVKLAKYYIILFFFMAAVAHVRLGMITLFLDAVLAYAPIIMGSAFVAITAALVGELVKQKIFELNPGAPSVITMGRVTKALLIFVGAVVALSTMGFNTDIASKTFITLVQGVIFGAALAAGIAFGLAFGLGGRKHAEKLIGSAGGFLGGFLGLHGRSVRARKKTRK